jgi:hypothetical protein
MNARALRRLRIWVCTRKVAYTLDEAEAVSNDMRMNGLGIMHPYKCPWEDHYHVGAERKDL